MPASLRSLPSIALTASVLFVTTPTAADAVAITVRGVHYEVLTQTTSYPSNSAAFALPPAGQMPWWGDDSLASDFATEVSASLGPGYSIDYGPIFAFSHDATASAINGIAQNLLNSNDQLSFDGLSALADYGLLDPTSPMSYVFAYGYALTPSAPAGVPAPLPLFGAGVALIWTRRIKGQLASGKR